MASMIDMRPDNVADPGMDDFISELNAAVAGPELVQAPAPEPIQDPELAPEPVPEQVQAPKPKRLTKKVLVKMIEEAQAVAIGTLKAQGLSLDNPILTQTNLIRRKVSELKTLHAQLVRLVENPGEYVAPTSAGTNSSEPVRADATITAIKDAKRELEASTAKQIARNATGLTLMLAKFLETGVNSQSDLLGVELDGFQARLSLCAEELEDSYGRIAAEEGVDNGPLSYISGSYTQLAIVLGSVAAASLKKKEVPVSLTSWPSSEPSSS